MTKNSFICAPARLRQSSHQTILCWVVALSSLTEVVNATLDLWLVGEIATTPDLSPVGLLILSLMITHLLLGLAVMGFAVTNRLRVAIGALALCELVRWTGDIRLLLRDTLRISSDFSLLSSAFAPSKAFG